MTVIGDKNNNPFHILALSGGGYKGLYTAQLIQLIEERSGKPFGSHFSLICGTSIGGIIALALATREIPANTIVDTLKAVGPQVFTKSSFNLPRGVMKAKHSNVQLRIALEEMFGDRKIQDLKTRVLIPTANWTKGVPQFFKTPHNQRFTTDSARSLVDVGMATSAAPIYLPNYEFEHQVYVDGGIVGNAPGIFGLHEAEHAIDEANDREEIYLLAIGALSSKITANQSKTLNKGLVQWNSQIFDFMMACQERTADFMLKQKMGSRYHLIDELASTEQDKVVALDKADEAATKTLQGLANITFQREIAEQPLNIYLDHQAPDLNFTTQ